MKKEEAINVAQASLPVYTVRKGCMFGLVVLAFTATVTTGAERDVLNTWKQTVSTNDFKKTLTDMKALQEEWPAVHSIKHVINKDTEKALLQTDYRNVAKTFWQGLEHYEKELREMSPEAFCTGADALLDVRERFLKHPSYINCFIVDTINRVIYVNLGERLIKAGNLPTCYDRAVERLAEFRCDWTLLYALVNGEYGTKQFSMAEIKELALEYKFEAIAKMIGQEHFFFIPQDAHNLYGMRILETRSSAALPNRLFVSDHIIGAYLPALLSYRKKATHFALEDTLDKIYAVLGDDAWLPPTMWEAKPHAVKAVNDFLGEVRSRKWQQKLHFSDPPEFTKERIERWEQEEAEREAQREAK